MLSPQVNVLSASNLQKYTIHAHETPRTKVIRYFNQVEDPQTLASRMSSPIPIRSSQDPWDFEKSLLPGIYIFCELTVGKCHSSILGSKKFPEQAAIQWSSIGQQAFHSEDSDILVHKAATLDRPGLMSPRKIYSMMDCEDTHSAYTWSNSYHDENSNGFIH